MLYTPTLPTVVVYKIIYKFFWVDTFNLNVNVYTPKSLNYICYFLSGINQFNGITYDFKNNLFYKKSKLFCCTKIGAFYILLFLKESCYLLRFN